MTIISIIFQTGEFYNQSSSNFWSTFLASLLGFAAPLIVFFLTIRKDKQKEEVQKKEYTENSLKYFSSLVASVIKITEIQVENYKILSENLTNQPFESHKLQLTIAEDLSRANKLDKERFFHAYLDKFGNSNERISIFNKIISNIDLISEQYKFNRYYYEKFISKQTVDLNKYKEIGEDTIMANCVSIMNYIKHNDPNYSENKLYQSINSTFEIFYNNKPENYGVEYVQNNFITILKPKLLMHSDIEDVFFLSNLCKKATWIFNESIRTSKIVADEFEENRDNMELALNTLKKLTIDLIIKE